MAFTQVAITGTVTLSNATPASGASVNFTLNTPITDGTQIVTPEELTVRCASDGTFTITLNANDDTTTLPLGTYYAVSIVYGTQTLDSFNVIVPHASSPVNLFTLATLPNPNVVSPYVSQIVAGTNVTVSPAGGTGIVTVNAAGSGGGSTLTPTGLKSSGTYAAVVGDEVLVDLSTANVTITLPTAPVDKSQVGWKIVKFAAGHTLTINTSGSDVFEVAGGATSNAGQILFQAKIYQYQRSTGIWIAESGDNSLTQLDARYNPVVQGAAATNLGASQTVDFQSRAREMWLVGTLNANLTVTVSNRVAGCRALLLVTQPSSGGPFTLTVTDGASPQTVPVNSGAGSLSVVEVACPDATAVDAASSSGAVTLTSPDSTVAVGGTTAAPTLSAGSAMATLANGNLNPVQAPVGAGLRNEPAIRPLKRDILILDNGANGNTTTNSKQILAEQFIADATTGAMYLLYMGTGSSATNVCLAKATGSVAAPASPDPTVNAFTDLGPIHVSGIPVAGDAPHIVIANGRYFLFCANTTAAGAQIEMFSAPQITSGVIVPLESAVWATAQICLQPAAGNVTGLTPTQGGAGSLPNSLQTFVVTARDVDGESGITTATFTPTASTSVVLNWTAPATGETNGYFVYRNGGRIATIAHGTVTYTVTGAETLGVAPPAYTSSSCTRLDEPFVFYDNIAGQWRMVVMAFNAAGTVEQVHLANLSSAGYTALTSSTFTFVKQNNTQPVIPAGNYAAVFGTTIPGGAAMATLYDFEVVADPFVMQVGSYFVIGYSAGAQGAIANTNGYRIALAYTKDFSTFAKLGVMHHPSAAKNPADATNGAALDGRGQNRAACASWRGAMHVDTNGIGHMPRCAKLGNGSDFTQAYYYQYDLSGLTDAIQGVRLLDPWVGVEAESTDARIVKSGFATNSGPFPYWSGGAIGGSGGHALFSTVIGDTITFTFSGTAVRVLMGRVSTTGTATITLDGGGTEGVNQFTNLDLTSDVAGTFTTVFAAQFDKLTPGVHQIKVTVVTTGASGIVVDRFDYIPQPGLPA